jgi:hypothetical protein
MLLALAVGGVAGVPGTPDAGTARHGSPLQPAPVSQVRSVSLDSGGA